MQAPPKIVFLNMQVMVDIIDKGWPSNLGYQVQGTWKKENPKANSHNKLKHGTSIIINYSAYLKRIDFMVN